MNHDIHFIRIDASIGYTLRGSGKKNEECRIELTRHEGMAGIGSYPGLSSQDAWNYKATRSLQYLEKMRSVCSVMSMPWESRSRNGFVPLPSALHTLSPAIPRRCARAGMVVGAAEKEDEKRAAALQRAQKCHDWEE